MTSSPSIRPTSPRTTAPAASASALRWFVSFCALAGLLLSTAVRSTCAQPAPAQAQPAPARTTPAPIERRPPSAELPAKRNPPAPGHAGTNPPTFPAQQHLAQWMDSHRTLPLDQQQRALSAEPGFRSLQPQVQQRMHDRLTQLNTMAPEQRQRVIDRTEAMERLTPPQRQQVRGAMQQLGTLPEDRRHLVARTFRYVRDLPEPQRQDYINSPQFRAQFSDQERGTLNKLIQVAPYLPPPSASTPPR